MPRRLIPGQELPAVGDEIGFRQRRVLSHDHELDRFPGPGVENADREGLGLILENRHFLAKWRTVVLCLFS